MNRLPTCIFEVNEIENKEFSHRLPKLWSKNCLLVINQSHAASTYS